MLLDIFLITTTLCIVLLTVVAVRVGIDLSVFLEMTAVHGVLVKSELTKEQL